LGLTILIGFSQSLQAEGKKNLVLSSQEHPYQVEILSQTSDVIWSFDFLPDGRVLFTERSGRLHLFDPPTKKITLIENTPSVFAEGQGGLLDVRVHPNFKEAPWVYLSYAEPIGKGKATTAVGRSKLNGARLEGFQKLFSAQEPNSNEVHFGSRIEFDGKGHIFFSVGDRNVRENVQSLNYHNGKILRLNEDGSVPKDNPFANQTNARPEIWSLGHRNPQGLAYRAKTGELWEAEFGPRGGDEVNLIERGGNYGWPVITYGREYYGPKIGEGTEKPGLLQPVAHWVPSISPSGITFYEGSQFPKWKGNLFLANLGGRNFRKLWMVEKKSIAA
jgi:glucose/arabinose dehydrogenase